MNSIDITEKEKKEYNKVINHPLQSFEWGEFRRKTGVQIVRRGFLKSNKLIDAFTVTLHKIPYTQYTIGYLPRGGEVTDTIINELKHIGKTNNTIFIQLEPKIEKISSDRLADQISNLTPSFHPLFTKYTFVIDLRKSEEELLNSFHHKTRYNIRLAQKKGVWIEEDNSKEGFQTYLNLTHETTQRQQFYAHNDTYHELQWQLFSKKFNTDELSHHLLHARYKDEKGITHTLASWVIFIFKDTMYYPYGASSNKFREVMASNLLAWEAIKLGKKHGFSYFDMWGALGPEPDITNPWYGFHRFKQGYNPRHVEYIGSYDLVLRKRSYFSYKLADKIRWFGLRTLKALSSTQ